MKGAVPIVVVAGFLGSGKTTLLNHILRESSGRARVGVVVNDFGSINIDALLVAGQAAGQVSLSNGCICCSVDPAELESTLASLVRPSAGLDLVVIEASGLAEPASLVRMIVGAGDRRISYGGLIYVVDAAHVDDHPHIDRILMRHISMADLLVVNKVDLVDAERKSFLIERIRSRNPQASVVATENARVDVGLLVDESPALHLPTAPRQLGLDELLRDLEGHGEHHPDHDSCHDHSHHDHLHEQFTSTALETDERIDPRALAEFLSRPPVGVFRIKGVVQVGRTWVEIHSVGGHVRAQRHRRGADERSGTQLVVIGTGVDEGELAARLGELLAKPDCDITDQDELAITRYLG